MVSAREGERYQLRERYQGRIDRDVPAEGVVPRQVERRDRERETEREARHGKVQDGDRWAERYRRYQSRKGGGAGRRKVEVPAVLAGRIGGTSGTG